MEKISNGDIINSIDLLDNWLIEAYKLDNELANLKTNNYLIYQKIQAIKIRLKKNIKTAEYYKTSDKQILNGCINSGQYVLDRLIRIKKIIIKYPQNKKTIMLGNYAKELLENYIGEVEFASNGSFDYINLPFISKYINNMKLIQSNCETILIENYQNVLKQKEKLQNQYNTKLEAKELGSLIYCSVVTFTGAIANTLLNRQIIMIDAFLALFIVLNLTSFKKIYNNIKYREEVKENKTKIKKLDRFIDTYDKRRSN